MRKMTFQNYRKMIFMRKFQSNVDVMVFYSPLKSRCSRPPMAYSAKGCELSWKSSLCVSLLATKNNAEFINKV